MSDETKQDVNLEHNQPETAPDIEEEILDSSTVADNMETEEETVEEAFDVEDYLRQYKELENACDKAKSAAEDAEAKLLRMQADFDNYRRRQRQDSEEIVKRAASGLVENLLPVVDNFERALNAMDGSPDKEGVELIAKQLMQTLMNAGLAEVEAQNTEFDPNFHQAVQQIDAGTDKKNKVVAVLQKGYTFNGKLLRAAMVQVGM